ncbi:translation protein [Lipomyces japonicus]|uniref:mitochondrial 54S ribosomal protein uL3m n=1 Tax=Lipomyces japonicus TaxID=56871 RepID=UPI0034CFE8E4
MASAFTVRAACRTLPIHRPVTRTAIAARFFSASAAPCNNTSQSSQPDEQPQFQTSTISSSIPIQPPDPNYRFIPRSELPLPVLLDSKEASLARKQLASRTGALAIKRGMTQLFDLSGKVMPVTMLQLDRVQVVQTMTPRTHGYYGVQVGAGARNARNLTAPELGHLAHKGIPPKAELAEFKVKSEAGLLPVGTDITVSHFVVGQFLDVRGISKGKGFAGTMKRHGFHGLRASHGVSRSHRSAGSTGGSQDPGRVLPFKKMAGHMGVDRITVQNVQVLKIIPEHGLILVKGQVPGPKNSFVKIQDAIKKAPIDNLSPGHDYFAKQ